jgi:hypothetical protein
MFDSLKRLISSHSTSADEGDIFSAWAKSEGHTFKRVKDKTGGGFVVETGPGWRVEWGESQRPYIHGKELRFRCDTGVSGDVQLILLSKVLAQTLESDVFSRYTNAMQTQIDNTLPDEMRWLAMHPRVALSNSAILSRRFVLLCNAEAVILNALNDHLLQALEDAASNWWTDALVLVVTLNRGMLTARMAGQPLEAAQLKLVGQFFGLMAMRLRQVAPSQG